MAYNNYYPMTYQPYQMQGTNMSLANQQPVTGLIWVQGEGAAKSYLVAPNSTVALFDNESQTIYIKSADASGMPSMRILDYTFRDNAPQTQRNSAQNDFATKEDIEYLKSEISSLRSKFEEMEGSAK